MNDPVHHASEAVRSGLDTFGEAVTEKLHNIKPRLRGWLHLGVWPLAAAAFVVLICLAPTPAARIGSTVFGVSALLLFGVSAAYHTGTWSPRVYGFLKRFDHANIFLLIAGSYTPFTLLLLDGTQQVVLLSVAWGGAILGVLFRVFWLDAPRWLYVPIYLALGWAAVFFLPSFLSGAKELGTGVGIAVFVLICAGGGLYTIGGAVYGFRRPDPWPRWFGFHEIFHSFTILAFTAHYVGVSLAVYSLR